MVAVGHRLDNSIVVIGGNRIAAVGPRETTPIPDDAQVVKIDGMSVLPGLIDSHFHSINDVRLPREFALFARCDFAAQPGHPFKYYRVTLQSKDTLPRIFLCGGHLDGDPAVWPDQAIVIGSGRGGQAAPFTLTSIEVRRQLRSTFVYRWSTCVRPAKRLPNAESS